MIIRTQNYTILYKNITVEKRWADWVNVRIARDDDTNQMSGISIPDECALVQRSIQVYIRLTHLVGEFTAYRCGTKPQRLFKWRCIAQYWTHVRSTIKGDELYTPYLLNEGENLVYTVCIHVERGYFSMYTFGITHGDF